VVLVIEDHERLGRISAVPVADIEPAAGSCRTLACEITGVITDPGIATGAVFAGVTALMALAYIRDAGETCRRERRRVLDERDAFRDFADNIEALDPVPVESSTANAGRPLTEHYQTIGPGMRQISRSIACYRYIRRQ